MENDGRELRNMLDGHSRGQGELLANIDIAVGVLVKAGLAKDALKVAAGGKE